LMPWLHPRAGTRRCLIRLPQCQGPSFPQAHERRWRSPACLHARPRRTTPTA